MDPYLQQTKEFMEAEYPGRDWYVVGGYFRDKDLGLEFKDIDVFVNGYPTDPLPETGTDHGERNAFLYYAVEREYNGFTINVIFMRGVFSLEEMTDRCDFGICQKGWCPKTDRMYESTQYDLDLANSTITLTRSTPTERVERMQDKLPEFVFRNPYDIFVGNNPMVWMYSSTTGTVERVPTTRKLR